MRLGGPSPGKGAPRLGVSRVLEGESLVGMVVGEGYRGRSWKWKARRQSWGSSWGVERE